MKRVLWSAIVLMMLAVGVAACGSSVAGEPAGSTVASTASTAATLPPTTASTTPPTTVAEVVVFNDPVLEERIRAALNKPQGDVTLAEAEAVKELDLENKGNKPDGTISDISALASFKNLKKLTISLNAIKDLSPLAGMNLEVFYSMNGNQDITDFSPLAGSTAMLDLTILGNENINDSNIGFIDGMTNIIMLWIQDAPQLSDISAVSTFPKLARLILSNCNVSDISPAAGLKNLKWLNLEGNPIKDYSPLKDIYPNLEQKDFELE